MLTPDQAYGVAQFLIPRLEDEAKATARILAAVPDDQADYKPHEKNMSAGELVGHIAFVEIFFLEGIINGLFVDPDDSAMPKMKPSEVVALYNQKIPQLLEQLKTLTGEQLAKQIQFYMFDLPAAAYLNFAQVHSIHHRGQLSVYLRPMGVKVPAIYGGSADEPITAAAQQA
jgi:uncharacterized damage-inducible protein DinB